MTGLALMASAESFIAIFIGLLAGIIIGAIPGLTADIAIILCRRNTSQAAEASPGSVPYCM